MSANKKAPALTEAQPSKQFYFSRILDAVTVIYLACILFTLFVGVLS